MKPIQKIALATCIGIAINITCSQSSYAQNVEGYQQLLENTYQYTVKQVQPVELNYILKSNKNALLLDTREAAECAVSTIENARCVGYNNFSIESIKDMDKNTPIYVYCSIGYRSERIGEILQQNGYKRVFNLYGGIFNWTNSGYPLSNAQGESTNAVHGYNKEWSQWLNSQKCIIELDK